MVNSLTFLTSDPISVVMPARDEGYHIYENVRETRRIFEGWGVDFEIIVVDDKSSDVTLKEAKRAQAESNRVRVVQTRISQGKGHALKEGFRHATGKMVIFLDSDLEIRPEQIKMLFEIMEKEGADVVIGSKRHPNSTLHYPFTRRLMSSVYFFLIKLLFGLPLRDTQTGLKLFKREVLARVFPKILIKGFAADLEILVNVHHLGYKIAEAPVVVKFKQRLSRIRPAAIYSMVMDALAVYYRMNILHYYDRPIVPIKRFPRISILITAKQRTSFLGQCIDACLKLDYKDYEIIVLSDDNIKLRNSSVKVVPTGCVSPARKRDMGLRHASGEIIAFLDDDAYPDFDWLKNGVRPFSEEDVVAVGGPAVTPPEDDFMQQISGSIYSSWLIAGKATHRYIPKMCQEVDDFPTSNFLIHKEALEKMGGFNTNFWPGEDTIICYKIAKQLGKKIIYDPDTIVYHHRRRLFIPHLKQVRNYALHRGYFAKRFPQTSLRLPYFIPSLLILSLSIGWIPGLFVNFFRIFYFSAMCAYLVLIILNAVKSFDLKKGIYVFLGVPLTHLTYGIYFIKGLLSRRLAEE